MKKRVRGFTIVELLIVIVVIAILAAVTVVAYSGIKQRADNSARVAAAKEWYKVFHTYLAQNGAYPNETSDRHFCLAYGYATNLDATTTNEDCFMASNVKHPSTVPLTALRTVASFPAYPTSWLTSASGGDTYVGISMRSHDPLVDDSDVVLDAKYRFLHFWLDGPNLDCVLRPVAVQGTAASTWKISTTASYTSSDGKVTRCVIPLPSPASV